jgi:rhodanese-related sulfurtransferase
MADYAGDLDPKAAWDLLEKEPEAVLVDVRTLAEWQYVGVPDLSPVARRAQFVEWQRFPDGSPNPDFVGQVSEVAPDPEVPVLFLCRSGVRSKAAAIALTEAGYARCYNVAEGFEGDKDAQGHRGTVGGWKVAGLPWLQG